MPFVQSAIDALSSHIAIINGDGVIVFVNAAWRAFATENGLDPNRVGLGTDYLEICRQARGEDAALAREAVVGIRSILEKRSRFFSMEYPCHSLEAKRWFFLRVTGFASDGVNYAVVAHENITQHKLDEMKLRESEDKFRKAFKSSPCMMAVSTLRDDRYIEVNESFEKVMGVLANDATRLALSPVDISVNVSEHNSHVRELLRQGRVAGREVVLHSKDNALLTGILSSEPIEINGEPCVLSTWVDITERKRLEEELAKSNKALTDRAKELEDLNTTLRVLLEQREKDSHALELRIHENIRLLVMPYLDRIRMETKSTAVEGYLDILENNFKNVTAGFARKLETAFTSLTSNEIKVADLVRSGMTSKDIANALGVSVPTADYYRRAIRAKLGLSGKKANLRAFLENLTKVE